MPKEPSKVRRIILVASLALVAFIAIASRNAGGRDAARFFSLGCRHGAEDRQDGMTYATDGVGWKMTRNGRGWTQSDKDLVQRWFAVPPAEESREASVFMAGYQIGFHQVAFFDSSVVLLALIAAMWRRTVFRRHTPPRTMTPATLPAPPAV